MSERGKIVLYQSIYEQRRLEAMRRGEQASERARRRREERGLPEPLPDHHPGQAQLVAA